MVNPIWMNIGGINIFGNLHMAVSENELRPKL